MIVQETRNNLIHTIIPFWTRLKDDENGGFYGLVDYNLQVDKTATKGVILNSRILWFFTNAVISLEDYKYLDYADHAYQFLKEHCLDRKNGGVFWSMKADGQPEDTTKHTYNQAFAIYALSSYYGLTHDEEVKKLAFELFEAIESRCKDKIGYMEAFNLEFNPIENDKLSENGLIASKTYNTLLHVLEAYTELYRVTKNSSVQKQIKWILDQLIKVVYNSKKEQMEVFFDENMRSISDLYSYGHDIETAWLMDRAVEVLEDKEYTKKVSLITKALTKKVYEVAYTGESLNNESFMGIVDTDKVWWVQAEAVVGFINGYEKDNSKTQYLEAAKNIWQYIKTYMIDARLNSEWFYDVNEDGKPTNKREIAGPWKCPYHNGRMCFEIMKRNKGGMLSN